VRGIFADAQVDDADFQRVHPRAERRLRRRCLLVFLLVWAPFWTPEKMEPRVRAYLGF